MRKSPSAETLAGSQPTGTNTHNEVVGEGGLEPSASAIPPLARNNARQLSTTSRVENKRAGQRLANVHRLVHELIENTPIPLNMSASYLIHFVFISRTIPSIVIELDEKPGRSTLLSYVFTKEIRIMT